jgi:hypothetical protein
VRISDGNGCTALSLGLQYSGAISNTPKLKPIGVRVYPNPASTYLNIELSGVGSAVEMGVYNKAGTSIWSKKIEGRSPTHKEYIDLKNTTPGMYEVRIKPEKGALQVVSLKVN